jgi:hypothetical protein
VPRLVSGSIFTGGIAGKNTSNITNCYYLEGQNGVENGNTTGLIWGQTLGTDPSPLLINDQAAEAGKQVHQLSFTFSNTTTSLRYANHGSMLVNYPTPL